MYDMTPLTEKVCINPVQPGLPRLFQSLGVICKSFTPSHGFCYSLCKYKTNIKYWNCSFTSLYIEGKIMVLNLK